MNAEIFAEWLIRQGHKVYKTASSYWYDAGPRVLQAFPFNWIISPDEQEIHNLMVSNRILALRYSAPENYPEGKMSYHIVLPKNYELTNLNQKARNGIKRGLEKFQVEEISFERLATEGWLLQEDTLKRQNRSRSMSRKQWELLCRSAADLQGFKAFAAIIDNTLAGSVIVSRIDDVYCVPYAMSHSRFLQDHVNNALFYTVSTELIKLEGVNRIFFTVQSLDAPANVDEFKLRMGLIPIPVRQNVAVHPYLKPFVSPAIHSINRKLLNFYPSNPFLAKTEGMLRFHLEGRRPVSEQNLPECLKDKRSVAQSVC